MPRGRSKIISDEDRTYMLAKLLKRPLSLPEPGRSTLNVLNYKYK